MSNDPRGEVWIAIRQRLGQEDMEVLMRRVPECESPEGRWATLDEITNKLTDAVMTKMEEPN